MWDDALSLLEQAEKLHRQFFRLDAAAARCWEPPIDVVESDEAVTVVVALPGVPASALVVDYQPGGITVAGLRRLPAGPGAHIHRIEIPYGRFERRIALPLAGLEPARQELVDGCLVLTLQKRRVER